MSIEIQTDYVQPLQQDDVIALLEGNISLHKANALKPIYSKRIDYIIQTIFKEFKRELNWYYAKDFTDTIEKAQDCTHSLDVSFIHKNYDTQGSVNIVMDNEQDKYSSKFPISWLYESFEEKLKLEAQTQKTSISITV